MKRFIYVLAVVALTDTTDPCSISFHSTEVKAPTIEEAYDAGMDWAAKEFTFDMDKVTVNDYVVALV